MKKVIFWTISAIAFLLLYFNRAEIFNVIAVTADSKLRWIFFAALAQVLSYYFLVFAHKVSLKTTGINRTERYLLPLVLAAIVVNTTAPTGGASGTVLFVKDAKDNHESPIAAVSGIILFIACYYVGLLSILSFILVYLQSRRELGLTEIVSTFILFLATAFYIYLLVISKKNPKFLQKILSWFNSFIYKIKKVFSKKTKLITEWPVNVAKGLEEASISIHDNPTKVIQIILINLATHFFNIASLFFIFLAFGEVTKFGIIIAGYAIGELFKIVSPSPEGIGVTEASMALVYSSFGIYPISATAISLVYRGLNFWLPFIFGFIVLHVRHLKLQDLR